HRPRAVEPAIALLHLEMLAIDPVPGRGGVIDEAFAALLAVGQQIEPEFLLLDQADQRRIVLRLGEGGTFEAELGARAVGLGEPGGSWKAAGRGGGKGPKAEWIGDAHQRRRL